jgi:hypothetical protein
VRLCLQSSDTGGTDAPDGNGYTKIYSNGYAFAALKADGSITAWGNSLYGGTGAPSDNGYTKIYSTEYAFPTKIIKGTKDIHLSKTPFFYCSIYCFLPVICQ